MNKKKATKRPVRFEIEGPKILELDELECLRQVTVIFAEADEIDDYISAQMRQLHIPGVSLAVVRDGRITKAQGYGFSNLELKTLATKETV